MKITSAHNTGVKTQYIRS